MCKRCSSGRKGLRTTLEVRNQLGIPVFDPIWIRELDSDVHPCYLVYPSGMIVAIKECDCEYWHIRLKCDNPDVVDSCAPYPCEWDTELENAGDSMLFDVNPATWALLNKRR